MPKAANTGSKEGPTPTRYKTEILLDSKALSGYQKDFARVLLTKPEYTLEEARTVLDGFFRKEGEK